jgi:hypothetical protein
MAIKPFIDLTNKRKTEQLSVSLSTDAESPPLVVRKASNANVSSSSSSPTSATSKTATTTSAALPLSASADSISMTAKSSSGGADAKSMSSDEIDVLDVGKDDVDQPADESDAPTAGRRIRDFMSSARQRVENASGRIQGSCCPREMMEECFVDNLSRDACTLCSVSARLKRSNTDASSSTVEDEGFCLRFFFFKKKKNQHE